MIAGNQLAKRHVEQMPPSPSASNHRMAWYAVRFPAWVIAKLYAAIEARVPVGYEDETGFHYSLKASDWVFSI
jgi:hypothetical protein